jgi:hypothetical protein
MLKDCPKWLHIVEPSFNQGKEYCSTEKRIGIGLKRLDIRI